jgi:hypothetical protein
VLSTWAPLFCATCHSQTFTKFGTNCYWRRSTCIVQILWLPPTVLYTNAAPPAARPPSSTLSHPPSGGNSGNSDHRNKNNNKNRNSGHGGGNNGKNNNGSGGHNSSSGQTTVPTASDGKTNMQWPTYGHPWQGHLTVYLSLVPTEQHRPQAFMATPGPYPSPEFLPGQQQLL